MTREELQKVLAEHKKWLNGEGGQRAALIRTDLSYTDMSHTNLNHANLSGAVLDYACWPLWCGSLNAHIDTRIAVQLLYHLMRPCIVSEGVDDEFKKALFTPELVEWANKFHRAEEYGEIEWPEEG